MAPSGTETAPSKGHTGCLQKMEVRVRVIPIFEKIRYPLDSALNISRNTKSVEFFNFFAYSTMGMA